MRRGSIDTDSHTAVAPTRHEGMPHPAAPQMVEVVREQFVLMAAEDHIIATDHHGLLPLPTRDGSNVNPHRIVGEPIGFQAFASVE